MAYSRAVVAVVSLALLALLGLAAVARGQVNIGEPPATWLIEIRADVPDEPTAISGRLRPDLRGWIPLQPRLLLHAWYGEQYFGTVNAAATWTVDPPDAAVVLEPGILQCQPDRHMVVTAEWNGQRATYSISSLRAGNYTMEPIIDPAGDAAVPAGPPVPDAKMRAGARAILNQLNAVGLNMVGFAEAFGASSLHDNAVSHDFSEVDLEAQVAFTFFGIGPTVVTLSSGLSQDLGAIADGGSVETPTGDLRPGATRLFHELMHVTAEKEGMKEDNDAGEEDPADPEKLYKGFHAFESKVLNPYYRILKQGKPTTPEQLQRFKSWLISICQWYRDYVLASTDPRTPDSEKAKRQKAQIKPVLKTLGLEDIDGNGLPDSLDRTLREWGLRPGDFLQPTDIAD